MREAVAVKKTRAGAAHLLGAVCAAAALCSSAHLRAETAPPEAVSAALDGLPSFLGKIPPGESALYGFEPGDPLEDARPGEPYRLREITPDALARFAPGDSVDSLVRSTGTWYFPVMLGGEARAILVVDRIDGEWRAVSLGQAPLAGELNAVRRAWPGRNGYTPSLVVNFQSSRFFFTVPQLGDRNLTPLMTPGAPAAAERRAERGYASTVELSKTVELLRPEVGESIRQPW